MLSVLSVREKKMNIGWKFDWNQKAVGFSINVSRVVNLINKLLLKHPLKYYTVKLKLPTMSAFVFPFYLRGFF